ncbi:unnamed protein product [Prorocentrum cordatum]|uniref:Uncharacterized protein n=1 Tax=Prorocentrum cordatum TaxID=2364126 RepID=A0ABN9XVM3_9DINO|nr:unnamed protein product [Polarella glacialis]
MMSWPRRGRQRGSDGGPLPITTVGWSRVCLLRGLPPLLSMVLLQVISPRPSCRISTSETPPMGMSPLPTRLRMIRGPPVLLTVWPLCLAAELFLLMELALLMVVLLFMVLFLVRPSVIVMPFPIAQFERTCYLT